MKFSVSQVANIGKGVSSGQMIPFSISLSPSWNDDDVVIMHNYGSTVRKVIVFVF